MQKDSENTCPNPACESHDIDYGCFDLIDGESWKQECTCLDCELKFTVHFTMEYDYTEYELPDK